MARGHLPCGSMVGWFMPLDTSLARGFLVRVFLGSSSYASMLYRSIHIFHEVAPYPQVSKESNL